MCISFLGYTIPAKSLIIYNVYALHRDEKYWGDPEEFRPERWIDENGKLKSHQGYFMPFGTGPRICPGESLAKVEFYNFVVALLQRYTFELATPEVTVDDGFAAEVYRAPSFKVKVHRRT